MDAFAGLARKIIESFKMPLFDMGDSSFTVLTLLYLILATLLLVFLASKLNKIVTERLLAKSKIDYGVRAATGSIIKYAVLTIGFIVILQTAGINLSSLAILFGALGIGIGFGLQNVINNFVSGLIILFERPIKVGDRIEVAGVAGDVTDISMRATTILTNDNISIIVPNSQFISEVVINWSHTDRSVRFNYPIGVSYKEDPEVVKKVLLEIAYDNPGVLKNPKPDVLFTQYGDSSMMFNLRVWTREYINRPGVLKSHLYYEISRRFRKAGIEIPFPQRDVHIKHDK
ncbi:MAG TPA: mechanosensitive ion channel [Smithellaceae bacterium]|nr:mechanosensitive ion channel [Smithellaceae bacterium]HRS89896.1 mechanosensitive ion channel [Smithellaceae bacterium]HRV26705.1 mechanosensitive ion channel [Smithellaceae bacterium]